MGDMYLGLDVGGTNLAAGVVDKDGNVIAKTQVPVGDDKSIETVTKSMYQVSDAALKSANLSWNEIPYWGIGMPSTVNAATGLLVHANCFGWHNVPIYSFLERFTDCRIYVENDANCAALAEVRAGAAKGTENAILLTLGTGVGGGIILDGKLYPGARGLGAELGHTKIVKGGRRCTCGQQGCLEAYASATALVRRGEEMAGKHPDSALAHLLSEEGLDGEKIFSAMERGDETADRLIVEYAKYLAAGISSFVSIFRPEKIILGGGISNAGEVLRGRVTKYLRTMTFGAEEIGIPEVVCARLGNYAGIIGAALLHAKKNKERNENDENT